MIDIILGLITFLAAAIQDYKTKQVNIVLLAPYFITVLALAGLEILLAASIITASYFIARQKYEISTGLGTADILLAAPTLFVFNTFDPILVLIALFIVPVIQSTIGYGERVAAIPGMTIGYILLIIFYLIF